MRVLKLAFISVIAFSIILIIISSLLPSHTRVSRATNVNAPVQKILPLVQDIRQWKQWNAYVQDLKHIKYDSSANGIGTGLQSPELNILLKSVSDTLIISEWKQSNGQEFTSGYYLYADGNVTVMQWYFDFKIGWYPWEKLASIIYDKQIGPQMEQSLNQVKQIAETNQ